MKTLALVHLADGQVVETYETPDVWVELPNGDQVSPAVPGWQSGGYKIVPVVNATIPAGNYQTAQPTYAYDKAQDKVIETIPNAPTPQPPAPTPAEIADGQRRLIIQSAADTQQLLNNLRTMSVSDIDAWITANVTTLPQARTLLAAILKLLASVVLG